MDKSIPDLKKITLAIELTFRGGCQKSSSHRVLLIQDWDNERKIAAGCGDLSSSTRCRKSTKADLGPIVDMNVNEDKKNA